MSVLDTMKGASAARRQVTLCLDGALQAEYDNLAGKLTDASLKDRDSLAREHTTVVVNKMETVREKMAASEVTFTFGRIPWGRRLELITEHPQRDKNLVDRAIGANTDTYYPALIREACASVRGVDGEEVTDVPGDVWDELLGALNYEQVEILFQAARNANDQATTVPTSARVLLTAQDSDASSKPPVPGTSPRNGSKAGSRPTPRKSATTKKAASKAS